MGRGKTTCYVHLFHASWNRGESGGPPQDLILRGYITQLINYSQDIHITHNFVLLYPIHNFRPNICSTFDKLSNGVHIIILTLSMQDKLKHVSDDFWVVVF